MWNRCLIGIVVVAACLVSTACQKLPSSDREGGSATLDASKLATTIPLEYGDLIAVTINSADTRWATLYFQKPDKSIVIIGLDRTTWKIWKEPHIYPRS
jgi:hypothetical protein